MTPQTSVGLRIVAATSLIISGAVHHHLYLHGYGHIPVIGTGFLIQASVFYAVAVLVVLGAPTWLVATSGVLALGSLGAFVLSRTIGIAGFLETGWEPAPYALVSVGVEVVTLGCAVILGSAAVRTRRTTSHRETL